MSDDVKLAEDVTLRIAPCGCCYLVDVVDMKAHLARSADMEARIRALRDLCDVWAGCTSQDWGGNVQRAMADALRALLDAAPAGGTEQVTTREEIDRVVEPLLDAPSEVPHD